MRPIALSVLAAVAALPASAQDRSLWDLIHPDRLATSAVRYAMVAMRSQMDLRYSDLTVSVAAGRVTIDDLEIALYDNITGGEVCDISIGGIEIFTGDPFDATRAELSIAARDVMLAPDCLPPDAAPVVAMLGPDGLFLPQLAMDVSYDVPSAAAQVHVATGLNGVVAATLDLDFEYLTVWAGDGDEPELSGDLQAASLAIENLGGWTVARGFLPPPFTNPDSAGAAMTQALSSVLRSQTEDGVLPKPAKEFVTEAAQGWTAFVTDPDRLILETGFDRSEPVFLAPGTFEDGPLELIGLMAPVVRQTPMAERTALPAELVALALDAPAELSAEARRTVGLALLTGEGAPRAVGRGIELLEGLSGRDGEITLAMANALAPSDPRVAYALALSAGERPAPGLRALLDDLEQRIPFPAMLELQDAAAQTPDLEALSAPVRDLAAEAEAHFSGVGAPRSLRVATIYASTAAALGHGGAARLLDRIDRSIPEEHLGSWSAVAQEVADTALAAWTASAR